jgi:hypothetical protein
VRDFVTASKAPATLRACRTDWTAFTGWCDRRSVEACPRSPETNSAYLTDLAGVPAIATLQRRLSSIAQATRSRGHGPPTRAEIVGPTWRGYDARPAWRRLRRLETADIQAMVGTLGDRLIDVRDRVPVLIGFAPAMRGGELTALDVVDVKPTTEALVVTIRRSKSAHEGPCVQLGRPVRLRSGDVPPGGLPAVGRPDRA